MNEETTRQRHPRITNVGMVGVPVTDQDRALEFYLGKLGFEKRVDVAFGDGERWVEVAPRGATTTITLVPQREGVPTGIDTGIRLTTEDAEAVHADLRARGVDADPAILHLGGVPPMFSFCDADGNRLRVVARHPRV